MNTASKSRTGTQSSVMNVRSQTVQAGVNHGTIPSKFADEMWIKSKNELILANRIKSQGDHVSD